MIFDSLEKAIRYYNISPYIKKGLMFLEDTLDLIDLPVGRMEIDGNRVFALVQEYETKEFDLNLWEAHKKYYDIQFIIEGTEEIKIARIEDMEPNTEYNSSLDYWLFSGEGGGIKITKNQFMILTPEDIHQPGIKIEAATQKIKKIVIKALI